MSLFYRGLLRVAWDHDPLQGGLKRYSNAEEFYAVVLTNIYISDVTNRSSSGLRADHVAKRPLEKELSDSFTFYESGPQVLPLMDQLIKEMPFITYSLVGVRATFNPLRAYFQNYHALKRLSHSRLAMKREILIEKLPLPFAPEATIVETIEEYFKLEAITTWRAITRSN